MLGTFATPARAAFGDDGPCTDVDHADKVKAVGARNEINYSYRLPRLGMAVSKACGKEVKTAILATEMIHPPDEPDEADVGGYYLLDAEDVRKHHGKLLHKTIRKKKLPHEEVPGVVYLDPFWHDGYKTPFSLFDPYVRFVREPPTAHTKGIYFIGGVVVKKGWQLTVEPLDDGYTIDDLIAMLPGDRPPPVSMPEPPSGLAPLKPTFEPVEADAFFHNGHVYRVGGVAGEPVHSAVLRDGRVMRLRATPVDGSIACQFLQKAAEVEAMHPSDAWFKYGAHEVVMQPAIIDVPIADLLRPTIVVPPEMAHPFALETSCYVMELAFDEDDELVAIQETVVFHEIEDALMGWAKASGNVDEDHVRRVVTEEIYQQTVVEKQDNFADTRTIMQGFSLVNACVLDPLLDWAGDRRLTLIHRFDGLEDVRETLGPMVARGWLVAPTPPDRNGRPRKRARKHPREGFVQPFTHADLDDKGPNWVAFSMETKTLEISLAHGFFGLNLKWRCGALPPDVPADMPNGKWDIVEREHRAPMAGALTLGRAELALPPPSYVLS